jgi:hypothetical protein
VSAEKLTRIIRTAVYDLVTDAMAGLVGAAVKITPISHAMPIWEQVWFPAYPGGDAPGGFDWRRAFLRFRRRAERFDAAIWGDGVLCGLAIGTPSRGRRHVSVHLLEGARYTTNPLKGRVLDIILQLADEYARALDAGYVRLMSPVAGMIPVYKDHGFNYTPRTTKCAAFCEREVQP